MMVAEEIRHLEKAREKHRGIGRTGLSVAALATMTLTLCVLLYSVFFPVWVYGFLADPKARNWEFFWQGLTAPLTQCPKLAIFSVALLLTLLGIGFFSGVIVKRLAARVAVIAFICFSLLCLDLLCVGAFAGRVYAKATEVRKLVEMRRAMSSGMEKMQLPQVPDVAFFLYLDDRQIDKLYEQIEPEWLDKQRTLTKSDNLSGKAAISAGPLAGEASGSSRNQNQLVQEPPKLTPERECLAFMKYSAENGRARSFSTAPEWLILSLVTVAESIENHIPPDERDQSVPLPLNSAQISEAQSSTNWGSGSEETKKINDELAKHHWKAELNSLLTQLPTYVFITGDFIAYTSTPPLLVHNYVGPDGNYGVKGDTFRQIQFDVTFPRGAKLEDISSKTRVRATAFGEIAHGLDQNGVIGVRALAVFK